MIRLGDLFVAICMLLIAASFGAIAYLTFGLTGAEASVLGLAALTGLALFQAVTARSRNQGELSGQIVDLSRGTADLARQVAEQGRRLATLEKASEAAMGKTLTVTQPIQAEIAELAGIVRQLAEATAAHDALLRGRAAAGAPMRSEPVAMAEDIVAPATAAERLAAEPGRGVSGAAFAGMGRDAVVDMLRAAIEDERFDIYLQPIVTLPQRKVRYYEALLRLATSDGQVLAPADFLAHAESAGLMPRIDTQMLYRCVRVLRRLATRNRDVGLFFNLSRLTLADRAAYAELVEVLEANRALAGALTIELPHAVHRTLDARESVNLSALTKLGFRLSVDHVSDLRFNTGELADRSCAFIKVPGSVLLDRAGQATSDIHAADLSGMLARFGIDLIAEKIESEATVVDLLDYDVKFGQGFLFSQPRPVRPEVLRPGIGEDLPFAPAPPPPATASAAVAAAPAPLASAAPAAVTLREPDEDAALFDGVPPPALRMCSGGRA